MKKKLFNFLVLVVFLSSSCTKKEEKIRIHSDSQASTVSFALEELKSSIGENKFLLDNLSDDESSILLKIEPLTNHKEEGFSIAKVKDKIMVTGFDEAVLMCGTLELAEQFELNIFERIQEITRNPYMEMRGPKFNISLDERTPSYSDASDAGQKNIPVMWDFDFWKEYIDTMAKYRYNYISLWSLHPFPSLVKVPGYEDIAFDYIKRSKGKWMELYDFEWW